MRKRVEQPQRRRRQGKSRPIAAAALIAVAAATLTLLFPFSDVLELKTRDLRSAIGGATEATAPVVIVAIDDVSFEAINIRWPWPRQIIADAILTLADAGARVIGLDVMMGDAGYTVAEDEALADAIAAAGNVVLPAKFDRRVQGNLQIDYYDSPLPDFASGARSVGYVNFLSDPDGLVRRIVPLDSTIGDETYAFSLEVLGAFEGSGVLRGATGIEAGGYLLPTTNSDTLTIKYAEAGSFPTVPFHQVLDGSVDLSVFRDAIVLIGAFFKESHDLFLSPVESESGLYGVEVHANVINTIYGGDYLADTSRLSDLVILILLIASGSLLLVRLKPLLGLGVMAGSLVAYAAVAVILFVTGGIILDIFEPMLAVVLVWVGAVLFRYLVVERQRQKVRSTFSRFVSREVVDSILDSGEAIELGGETREVVIFFSDICGFTPLSESMSPADVVELLNEYFTEMTEIVFQYEGTVNKYIGDAIMAFYGAPVPLPDVSERAVRACLEMRAALAALNQRREEQGKRTIAIGMGLHKGQALIGNIGSPRQMEYTVIGDAVNVSSRIEGLTRDLDTDLLISDDVYSDVRDLVNVKSHGAVAVKGKSGKVVVHTVLGLKQ